MVFGDQNLIGEIAPIMLCLERIMDMALDMRDCVQFVPDPRPGVDDHIKIRFVHMLH